jgi:hypothetical protein
MHQILALYTSKHRVHGRLPARNATCTCRQMPKFRRKVLPPSSGLTTQRQHQIQHQTTLPSHKTLLIMQLQLYSNLKNSKFCVSGHFSSFRRVLSFELADKCVAASTYDLGATAFIPLKFIILTKHSVEATFDCMPYTITFSKVYNEQYYCFSIVRKAGCHWRELLSFAAPQ